jgi:tetratricopeptide (TPR) repeat protein
MSKPGKGPPRAPASTDKVVSIVPELERKRLQRAHQHAAVTHLRQLEAAAEMSEHEAALEEMDLDGGIAWCEGESSREARVSWAELRSLRALRSCMRGDTEAGFAEWAAVRAAEPGIAAPHLIRSRWLGRTDVRAALTECERAVAAEPKNATAYARRGDCHRVLGDPERAIADYRRAVGLDPELFDVHYIMGTVFGGLGKLEEARAAYTRAIRLAPRYVEFYLGRAATLEQLGDFAGAVRDLDRVLELDPSRVEVRSHRALCLARVGGPGDLPRAVAEMAEIAAGELFDGPGAHETFTLLGGIHLAIGERDKALAAFDRALQLAPDDVSALAQRGRIHVDAGEHERALRDLDQAAALAPNDAEHHVARAKPLALLGRFDEAVSAASRAIELAPDHVLAHRLRAVYRSHAEEGDAATAAVTADLRRAWELSPKTAVYRKEYLEHLENLGAVDEAIAVFDKALALEPDSAELHYERGACKVGREEQLYASDVEDDESEEDKQARLTSAIADLERALELGKRDEDVYWELVRAREGLGDQAAKLAELDRAITALPDFLMAILLRQSWRHHAGDVEGAAADRARLVELGHQFPED